MELSLENIVMLALSVPYYSPLFIFLYQAKSDKLSKRQHFFEKLNKHAEIQLKKNENIFHHAVGRSPPK